MKFSVIIPVYDVFKYLLFCLDSVFKQSYTNCECICIDDGSKDGSANILDECVMNDSRYLVVHQTNRGVAKARNAGLDLMTGDYFLFLDGDDVWHSQLLQFCVNALKICPAAEIISFGYKSFREYFVFSPLRWNANHCRITEFSGAYNYCHAGFTAWNKAYHRYVFGNLRERAYCVGEDILFLTQAYFRLKIEISFDYELYGYRIYEGSTMRRPATINQAVDSILFIRDIINVLSQSKRGITKLTAHWLSNTMTELFYFDEIRKLSNKADVRRVWREVLSQASNSPLFTFVQRMRMRMLFFFPYFPFTFVLCFLPSWLKRNIIKR